MQLDKDLNLELARRLRLLARRYPTGDPTRTLLMLSAEGLKAAYGDQDYPTLTASENTAPGRSSAVL